MFGSATVLSSVQRILSELASKVYGSCSHAAWGRFGRRPSHGIGMAREPSDLSWWPFLLFNNDATRSDRERKSSQKKATLARETGSNANRSAFHSDLLTA